MSSLEATIVPLLNPDELSAVVDFTHRFFCARMRSDLFAVYVPPGGDRKKGIYTPVKRTLVIDDITGHIFRGNAVGQYLLSPDKDGFVKTAVIDLDDHDGKIGFEALVKEARLISNGLTAFGLLPWACRSGSGTGIHLWLLWADYQGAGAVRDALRKTVDASGVTCHVDIFPAQSSLHGRMGNLVALPFARQSRPLDLLAGSVAESLGEWIKGAIEPALSRPLEKGLRSGGTVDGQGLSRNVAVPVAGWADEGLLGRDQGRGLTALDKDLNSGFGPQDPRLLADALKCITATDYHTWMKYGLALKVAAATGQLTDDQGFELWCDWAKGCAEKYDEQRQYKEWGRFRAQPGLITIGTILMDAKNAGWDDEPVLDKITQEKREFEESKKQKSLETLKNIDMSGRMSQISRHSGKRHRKNSASSIGLMLWLVEKDIEECVKDINDDYFLSVQGSRTFLFQETFDDALQRKMLARMGVNDFKILFQNQKIPIRDGKKVKEIGLGEYWIDSKYRRTYQEIVLRPEGCEPWQYNMWSGWNVEQSEEGSWSMLKEHMLENICGGDSLLYEYLFNWLALTFQKPQYPIRVALVLRGNRGTGKSSFVRAFGELFGQHFLHVTSARAITGNFNSHLRDCLMLFADEAVWAGNRGEESTLKGLITEPTINIECKGQDAYTCRNMIHMIIATNHDWAVPAGADERRFCCFNVGDGKQQNIAYFTELQKQLQKGGSGRLLWDLLNHDVSTFSPDDVPQTEELTKQKLLSMEPVIHWWHDKLISGTHCVRLKRGGQIAPINQFYEDYIAFCGKINKSYLLTPYFFSLKLQSFIPGDPQKIRQRIPGMNDENKHGVFLVPNLEACREHFSLKVVRAVVDWDESIEDVLPNKGIEEEISF